MTQPPYGPPPEYGQPQYGQPAYGPPPGYGPPGYGGYPGYAPPATEGNAIAALILAIAAATAIFRFNMGMLTVLAGSCAAGVLLRLAGMI